MHHTWHSVAGSHALHHPVGKLRAVDGHHPVLGVPIDKPVLGHQALVIPPCASTHAAVVSLCSVALYHTVFVPDRPVENEVLKPQVCGENRVIFGQSPHQIVQPTRSRGFVGTVTVKIPITNNGYLPSLTQEALQWHVLEGNVLFLAFADGDRVHSVLAVAQFAPPRPEGDRGEGHPALVGAIYSNHRLARPLWINVRKEQVLLTIHGVHHRVQPPWGRVGAMAEAWVPEGCLGPI